MRKIFVAIAAVAAITFSSCGNSTNEATDQDTTEVEEQTDELAALEEAVASGDEDAVKEELTKLHELAANLDSTEVKKFAYKLQEFAANHKEDLDKLQDSLGGQQYPDALNVRHGEIGRPRANHRYVAHLPDLHPAKVDRASYRQSAYGLVVV